MFKSDSKANFALGRRGFLKAGFYCGLPLFAHSFLTILFDPTDAKVASYTRVAGHSSMTSKEFNTLKPLWINGSKLNLAIQEFQKRGFILSCHQTHEINSASIQFVFASKEAKQNFDNFLVMHKIFNEKKLLELGLTHETNLS